MKRTLVTIVMSALVLVAMSSGFALAAQRAAPPFKYAFADVDGDGVFTAGVDLPAVESEGGDGSWVEITVPDSLIDSTGHTSAVLVFPSKTKVSEGTGAVTVSTPGRVQIGAGVHMYAASISISGSGLVVGTKASLGTPVSGDITIDVGDGGIQLDRVRFDTMQLTLYAGVDYGNGRNGALVADGVKINAQLITIGTKEGISLTNSTVHFMSPPKGATWDSQASLTTNLDPSGVLGSPFPVNLTNTTFAGPHYYFVDIYGSPVVETGMKMKGTCDLYVSP